MFIFLMQNEDNKLIIKYSKRDNLNESNFQNKIKIHTRLLISYVLSFFVAVVEKEDMSGCQCHWCNLSTKEWSEKLHTMEWWTID